MAIFRVHKTKDYAILPKDFLRNVDMSLKSKGLLSLMLSLADDWDFSIAGLSTMSKDGKDAIISSLKELEDFGYVFIESVRDDHGRYDSVFNVYETPMRKNRIGSTDAEKPNRKTRIGERNNNNTEIPPTTISPSKDGSIDSCPPKGKRFVKPSVEEVQAYCLERGNGIDANAFIDFYESKGWLIGKNQMKDWKAAVRTWEQRHKEDSKRYGTRQHNSKFADPEESARAMLAGLNAAVTERNIAQNLF